MIIHTTNLSTDLPFDNEKYSKRQRQKEKERKKDEYLLFDYFFSASLFFLSLQTIRALPNLSGKIVENLDFWILIIVQIFVYF